MRKNIQKYNFDINFLNLLGLSINKKYTKSSIFLLCCGIYSMNKLVNLRSKYFPDLENMPQEDHHINNDIYRYIKDQIILQIIDNPDNYLFLNKINHINNLKDVTIYI